MRLEASIERDQKLLPPPAASGGAGPGARGDTGAPESSSTSCRPTRRSASGRPRSCGGSRSPSTTSRRGCARRASASPRKRCKVAQIRDRETATGAELAEISQKLGQDARHAPSSRSQPEERAEIEARLERLERRRERIGPVNPLAEGEYQEALEHVEDLERQRKDLEGALAELETLIRETDRRIRESFQETFEITARNFEEVIQHLFPGGRGKLRLVKPPQPRVVLGGAEPEPRTRRPPQRPRRATIPRRR